MKLTDWLPVVPFVQNGWTFAFCVVLLGVWLWLRLRRDL